MDFAEGIVEEEKNISPRQIRDNSARVWTPRNRISIPVRDENFYLLDRVQTGYGTNPASCPTRTRVKTPGGLKLICHLHLVLRLTLYVWSYASTPLYIFVSWCLIKQADFIFTFTFIIAPKTKIAVVFLQHYSYGRTVKIRWRWNVRFVVSVTLWPFDAPMSIG